MDRVEPVIADFPARFEKAFLEMMAKKLGLRVVKPEDKELTVSLLNRLTQTRLDYTITFDRMTRSLTSETAAVLVKNELGEYFDLWQKRLSGQSADVQDAQKLMRQHNPVVIPRSHHVEAVIQECEQNGKTGMA